MQRYGCLSGTDENPCKQRVGRRDPAGDGDRLATLGANIIRK